MAAADMAAADMAAADMAAADTAAADTAADTAAADMVVDTMAAHTVADMVGIIMDPVTDIGAADGDPATVTIVLIRDGMLAGDGTTLIVHIGGIQESSSRFGIGKSIFRRLTGSAWPSKKAATKLMHISA